jgi:hypothetical protein
VSSAPAGALIEARRVNPRTHRRVRANFERDGNDSLRSEFEPAERVNLLDR